MNRQTLSLIAGATALAAVTGFATLLAPDAPGGDTTAKAAAQLPVQRTSLLCPRPSTSDVAETAYTAFTPVTEGTGEEGGAELVAAGGGDDKGDDSGKGEDKAAKPVIEVKEPGKPVADSTDGGDSPALIGTADGDGRGSAVSALGHVARGGTSDQVVEHLLGEGAATELHESLDREASHGFEDLGRLPALREHVGEDRVPGGIGQPVGDRGVPGEGLRVAHDEFLS